MKDPRTILLVEDDPDEAELAREALRALGIPHELVVAEDGDEALDYLFRSGPQAGRRPGSPDVVLLDLKLPGLGGIDVLRRIRAHGPTAHVPVVVLTSSLEAPDLRASYASGANSYVQKPVDFEEFLRAVRQLGAYWLGLNEPPPEGDP